LAVSSQVNGQRSVAFAVKQRANGVPAAGRTSKPMHKKSRIH